MCVLWGGGGTYGAGGAIREAVGWGEPTYGAGGGPTCVRWGGDKG